MLQKKANGSLSFSHIYQTLQRRGHPSFLSLHKHNPSVHINDNATKSVQLFTLMVFGHYGHKDNVVLICLDLDKI